MKDLVSRLNKLEACLRADLEGQRRALAAFERQTAALREGGLAELEESTRAVRAEQSAGLERGRARERVLEELASHLRIGADAMTVSSLLQRLETDAGSSAAVERLRELRGELRRAAALALRAGRRLSALVRVRRQVIGDALTVLLCDPDGVVGEQRRVATDQGIGAGALVDAKA